MANEGNQNALGNDGGRPTKFESQFCEQVFKLCLLGATDKEIANFFEVSEATITNWKQYYPEFLASIKEGKLKADANVANSLYKRAIGFEYDEITWERIDSKENLALDETGEMVKQDAFRKKIVTKCFPGDIAAQNIWLKNRRSKRKVDEGAIGWADKVETEHSGNINLTNEPVKFE